MSTVKRRGRPPASSKIQYQIQGVVDKPSNSQNIVEFDIYNISLLTKIFKHMCSRVVGSKEIIFSCWGDELYMRATDHFNMYLHTLKYDCRNMARYFCNDVIHFKIDANKLEVLQVKVTSFACIRFGFRPSLLNPGTYDLVLHMFTDLASSPKENIIDDIEVVDKYMFGERHQMFETNINDCDWNENIYSLLVQAPLNKIKAFSEDKAHTLSGERNPVCTFTYDGNTRDIVIKNYYASSISLSCEDKDTIVESSYPGIIAFSLHINLMQIFACSGPAGAISDTIKILYIKDAHYVLFRVMNAECTFSSQIIVKGA
jgi:hypothetical protein